MTAGNPERNPVEQSPATAGELTGPLLPKGPDGAAIPRQLGDYRILREIGRGGMGVVFEAVQESLGRHVALKVLPYHALMQSSHLERFRREAKAAGRLHHSNIVPVFGVGEDRGVHFFAMQFIRGQSLDVVLARLRILRQPDTTPPGEERTVPPETQGAALGLLSGQLQVAQLDGGSASDGTLPP